MADSELIKAQNEVAKQAREDSAKNLAAIKELISTSEKPKDRVKLLKMQEDLAKTQRNVSGDLGKNISDMKDGFTSTVDGMINQTFGPLGGMVTSLTTGFLKRGKENRENITQNELQNENAKDLIATMGGVRAAVEKIEKKTAPRDLDQENAAKKGGKSVGVSPGKSGDGKQVTEGGVVDSVIEGITTAAGVGGGIGGAAGIKALGGKYKALVGKLTGGVAGKVLSKANPVFAAITMGKDIFDIASAVTDDDVKTSVKKEDIGGLIGGFIGGAIGIIGGPAGVALGIGLGNMAGEFIGQAMESPEILGAIKEVKNNLKSEQTALAEEIAMIESDIKATTDPIQIARLEAQKKQLTARQVQITNELKSIEDENGEIAKQIAVLDKIDADSKENRKKKYLLESKIKEAESRGDDAMVTRLQSRITVLDKDFAQDEKNYEEQSKKLKEIAQKTSATLAAATLSFTDRMATEGGFMGTLLSGFGLFGTALEGDEKKAYMKDQKTKELAKLEGKLAKAEAMELSSFVTKEQAQLQKDRIIGRYRDRVFEKKAEIDSLARGGFIVNKPTYLPNSGVVVGEHGTYSGRGAAYGGIADGGPEAVIPLSSTRAGAFIDPMAQSVAGQVMNRLQMERMSGGAGGGGGATIVTDSSSSQVNNNTTVINNPSPIGQTLPDEGRDFVSKVA